MPRPTGGCILFFTLRGGCVDPFSNGAPPERQLRKQEQLMVAFEFSTLDTLLDCVNSYARSYAGEHRLAAASELYTSAGKYRLLLCPAQELAKVQQFFSEYGNYCGDNGFETCRTREHWRHIGDEPALEALCGQSKSDARRNTAPAFSPGSVYVPVVGG
jgi:hypothetical protein